MDRQEDENPPWCILNHEKLICTADYDFVDQAQ